VREWHIVTVPEDHRLGSAQVDVLVLEQLHDAGGRARDQPVAPLNKAPRVRGCKPIDVLDRIDQLDHRVRVDVTRHGQLQQDPADRVVGHQPFDQLGQLRLGRARGQLVLEGHDSGLGARLVLVAHVDL
jgi:hypothetical protein